MMVLFESADELRRLYPPIREPEALRLAALLDDDPDPDAGPDNPEPETSR
ncbi:MAG TPA: hypothetical protein VD931_01045 [Baekduia sp.]|nr:hypothetical protein [Baekduia sp.]